MEGAGVATTGGSAGIIGRTAIAATFGGLVSEATGGDFASGAATAAIVHLFNQEAVGAGQKEWIGLKTNDTGDIIICLGSNACASEFNIANATAEDLALEGAALAASSVPIVGKAIKPKVTKATLKRIKRLIMKLSDNSRRSSGLSQHKVEQLQRIVEKAGGTLRNDGVSGRKGSSAGIPHVQVEGMGSKIKSRHIWTESDIEL